MLLVLQHTDGRWCAPSMQDGEITEEAAQKWADAVCETLGFPVGSLVPHVVEDAADPRTGELIEDPNVAPDEPAPEPQPDRIAQLEAKLAAVAAYAGVPKEVVEGAKAERI